MGTRQYMIDYLPTYLTILHQERAKKRTSSNQIRRELGLAASVYDRAPRRVCA